MAARSNPSPPALLLPAFTFYLNFITKIILEPLLPLLPLLKAALSIIHGQPAPFSLDLVLTGGSP